MSNNIATSNEGNGFHLQSSSSNNILNNNTATSNSLDGFSLLASSSSNTLNNNIATNNTQSGFYVLDSNNNTLQFNCASANQLGVFLDGSSQANSIVDNTMFQNILFHAEDNASAINFWNRNSYGDYVGGPGNPDTYTINRTADAIDLSSLALDTDMDGMLDWFESQYGLDVFSDDSFSDVT